MKKLFTFVVCLMLLNGCSEDIGQPGDFLYCDMVAEWRKDAARGVPLHDRSGWAPFDDNINCPTPIFHRS